MKTRLFTALIEAAMAEVYSPSDFETVPYMDGNEVKYCLGLPMSKGEHFAAVVARACQLTFEEKHLDGDDRHESEIIQDIQQIVATMRVAPYMQWTMVYFPCLTEEQVLAAEEVGWEPTLDVPKLDPSHVTFQQSNGE
jgi:hypothetical protein